MVGSGHLWTRGSSSSIWRFMGFAALQGFTGARAPHLLPWWVCGTATKRKKYPELALALGRWHGCRHWGVWCDSPTAGIKKQYYVQIFLELSRDKVPADPCPWDTSPRLGSRARAPPMCHQSLPAGGHWCRPCPPVYGSLPSIPSNWASFPAANEAFPRVGSEGSLSWLSVITKRKACPTLNACVTQLGAGPPESPGPWGFLQSPGRFQGGNVPRGKSGLAWPACWEKERRAFLESPLVGFKSRKPSPGSPSACAH